MPPAIDIESTSVHTYLGLLQTVINRMAANSSACKNWCITLVSAILAIIAAQDGKPEYVAVAAVPVILFLFLDCYYLALGKLFRAIYDEFVDTVHAERAKPSDLFLMMRSTSKRVGFCELINAVRSLSIWPFYGLLGVMVVMGWWMI